jgi:hypothetical protein
MTKLELERTQPQMTQKPVLRGEVGALARRVSGQWLWMQVPLADGLI